jgi:hypothetical protein
MKSLEDLIKEFEYIKTLRGDTIEIFNEIQYNLDLLSKIYIDVVKKYHSKDSLFGLDSFHFQNKMIEMEYESIHKIFICIDNRIYCEYYKLYKIIHDYIVVHIKDNKLIEKLSKKTYPIYKDLEPLKVYDFEVICDIYSTIIKNIQYLTDYLIIKKSELEDNTEYSDMGLNIHNIINIQHFSNALLNERIKMFTKYLDTINTQISKYISRLILKSKLMIGIVNQDIQLKQINNTTLDDNNNNNNNNNNNKLKSVRRLSTINSTEEENLRNFINYDNTHTLLQKEFNNIILTIPSINEEEFENKDDENKDDENKDNENKDNENKDNENKDDENKDDKNKDDENKDDENKDDNISPENE